MRRNHSLVIDSLVTWPGTDVAVATDGADFRWANDYAQPVLLTLTLDAHGILHTAVYGVPDGRSVQITTPQVLLAKTTPVPVWRLAPALAPLAINEPTDARPGMQVAIRRTVRNGETLTSETIRSVYNPMPPVILHGAQVTPGVLPTPVPAPGP